MATLPESGSARGFFLLKGSRSFPQLQLQAALQRAMEEMAQFSGTLSNLQADVTNVKDTQGKMKTDDSIFQ